MSKLLTSVLKGDTMKEVYEFDKAVQKLNNNDLRFTEKIDLFQNLIDSGQLWRCGNEINIEANCLIDSGHIYKR